MKRNILMTAALALLATSVATPLIAADLPTPRELLEQTRSIRQQEEQMNKEREARFLAEHDKQASVLAGVKSKLLAERKRSADLTAAYESNEKKLAEMQTQLEARSGNLGEMFGVVRQVAADLASVSRNSIITAQYPDRTAFIEQMAASKALPSQEQLERFWFELQREITESGAVVQFTTDIVKPDGGKEKAKVTRVGPFTATSEGRYLAYIPSETEFSIMPRQPGAKFQEPAKNLEELKTGYTESVIDPTRGVMLSIHALRPNWGERIENGESVNYVILLVGAIGSLLAIYQIIYLLIVRNKVKRQLVNIDTPSTDNPLGRVLSSFQGDAATLNESTEVVELRISEAVLREVPPLERFQAFLRLAVSAGPLLGLIGTVIGMIITFQSITESGSSDPKLMAAGISAAMIATVLGLGIAIPLLFANAWLVSMSKSITQVLDEQSTGLLANRVERMGHA